ncbi:MAG: MBL fold metallo-hydrolase [Oscillospiraceae bacterium]|nr:MBL fold metallo-hydrolase [Oscillospiraceae bacterium]
MAIITPLCSSSSGNSVFAGSRSAGVLIDMGCSFKKLRLLLDLCGVSLDAVRAVLVTHEHVDHVKGLYQLTKHTDIPIYSSRGTLRYLQEENLVFTAQNLHNLEQLKNIPLDYEIKAFETPHDALDSAGFTLENRDCKIAYCTDLGTVTERVREGMRGADYVFIESNYQPDMLRNNPRYPAYIKQRISSSSGHLSNGDCAEFVAELVNQGATRFILGHLSRENNTPEIAAETAVSALHEIGAMRNRDYFLEVAAIETAGEIIAV